MTTKRFSYQYSDTDYNYNVNFRTYLFLMLIRIKESKLLFFKSITNLCRLFFIYFLNKHF